MPTGSPAGPLPADWTLPRLNKFNAGWFSSGAVRIQTCTSCDARQHPPEQICHRCGSMTFGSTDLGPGGTVHSYTVAHYAVNPALADSVPYAVVLVALDDDPDIRIIGNVLGVDPAEVHIGMKVTATWVEAGAPAPDGEGAVQLIQWVPA